ncbi:MAG: hypothetical protein AAF512_16345 [Pseudomonadota bacterium]
MKKLAALTVIIIVFLAGCSSKPERGRPEMLENFSTKIEQDGTKLFAFSVQTTRAGGEKRRSGGGGRGGMGGGLGRGGGRGGGAGRGGMSQEAREAARQERMIQMEARFESKLSDKMVETGYCKDGYIEVDRNIGRGFMILNGKCRDSATEDDKKKFAS